MITIEGQVYDGINDKPPLDEYIEHLDHKYISKHKGKNGKWIYKYKSKIQELGAKIRRRKAGITDPEEISNTYRSQITGNIRTYAKGDRLGNPGGKQFHSFKTGTRVKEGVTMYRQGQTPYWNWNEVKTTKVSPKVSRKPKNKKK